MKIEAEKMSECVATEELVRELVRNDARRGEYMIMMDDADEERFVQISCDYEDVGGKSDGRFDLEYQEGTGGRLYHCKRRVSVDEVERVFLDELAGRIEWRGDFDWETECDGGSVPSITGVPSFVKVLFYVVAAIAIAILAVLLSIWLFAAVKDALRPEAKWDQWVSVGLGVAVAYALFLSPVIQFVKRRKTRGKARDAHERTIPMEGKRLRRILPSGVAFLAFWCIGWNAAVFCFLKVMAAPAGSPESRLDGGVGSFVFDAVFPLIGIAMTVYCIWLLWKHLRPSYEVRLAGGVLKEGERAKFEYRFKGDAEKVERVSFATACDDTWPSRALGTPPGRVNDEKEFTHPLELASGSVTLEMPRIAKDCHTAFRYYFRATVVFKSGLTVASSYRIPLK